MTTPLRIKHLGHADTSNNKEFLQSYSLDYLCLWVRTKAWELFLADHGQEWEAYLNSVADNDPEKRRER
jgi:hypothetical protein